MNRQLEVYFYLKSYYNRNGVKKNLVAAITRHIRKGPYFEFERRDRHASRHPDFQREIEKQNFSKYNHLRITLKGNQVGDYYDDATNTFKFRGKSLSRVDCPGSEYSSKKSFFLTN